MSSVKANPLLSENQALKDSLIVLTTEIQKLKLDLEILNQDRRLLYQETVTLKDENTRLQAAVTRLEMANEKYLSLIQQSNDKLQKSKNDQMTAVQNIRSMSYGEQDKEFRAKFKLPEGEFPIISYTCCNENFQAGILHITPFYICFELLVNLSIINAISKTTEPTITIPLKDIVSLNKVKPIKFLPGKGTFLEVKTADSVRVFKHFLRRKEASRNIFNQAATINHTISMLREGEPDNNTS
eukprot:gene1426-1800_t